MSRSPAYVLRYAPKVRAHVHAIERQHHRLIQGSIKEQLSFMPSRRTRSRKPLERLPGPFGSAWEWRFGPGNRFGVFYKTVEGRREVWVLAIGVKDRGRLTTAGKEFRL